MVLGLDIDLPHVVGGAVDDVLDGEHRRVHRVVLIVVAMHAVAAHRVDIGDVRVEPASQHIDVVVVGGVVHRVGLRHPNHEPLFHDPGLEQPEPLHLRSTERNEIVIARGPEFVAFGHEIFETEAGLA